MNIGIFETRHFEGAYPMIRILDMPGNRLTIFVNDETYNRFNDLFGADMKRYTWIVKPEHISNRMFVWHIFSTCKRNNTAVLFLNTVTANFIWYAWLAAFLPSVKVIMTLHDANNFLQSQFSWNVRKTVRHTGKKMLARFCHAYSTVSETVQHYLKTSMGVKKNIFCIPGAVFERENNPLQVYDGIRPLQIVIAGSIDNRRRDYDKMFDLLENVNKHSLPVVIVLAGGPYGSYGQTMINRIRAYNQVYHNLIFYESPVIEQAVFDAALDNCHFVWIPSVVKTVIADDIEEIYGRTKSSGNIFDAIKHARPLLVPEELAMPEQLYSSVFSYNSTSALFNFLATIIRSPDIYKKWAGEAFSNSMGYTVEKMRKRVIGLS